MLGRTKKIHMVGIGGIGMSGIAGLLLNQGFIVTGSDLKIDAHTQKLAEKGAKIVQGHSEKLITTDIDVVVISSAIQEDNTEVVAAKKLKIPVIKRAKMLSEFMRMRFGIGIAGTHGKTTTTSLVGMILNQAKLSPTIIVGGIVKNIDSNSQIGKGDYVVVEADEYDRTFLSLNPIISGITNIELEHVDCYTSIDDLKEAFIKFANSVPFFGLVAVCLEDENIQDIIPKIERRILTYGFLAQADIRAKNLRGVDFTSEFDVYFRNKLLGKIKVDLIGNHNVLNCLMAIAIALDLDIDFQIIQKALGNFSGIRRRMEKVGQSCEITILDDYAHHPTEIKTTLEGLKNITDKRIVVLFQPHLYSRTRDFAEEFGKSFMNADKVFVSPIYPAREEKIEGVSSKLIIDAAIQSGHHNIKLIENSSGIVKTILKELKKGDILITFGAGDIDKYGREILLELDR